LPWVRLKAAGKAHPGELSKPEIPSDQLYLGWLKKITVTFGALVASGSCPGVEPDLGI